MIKEHFIAGQIDHAGFPEMDLQAEVDELCCIANALNISTTDLEAAVLNHYGNHREAMKVSQLLLWDACQHQRSLPLLCALSTA